MRAYRYVIATDAGSAPNYAPPMTTLAICKPRIRSAAMPGDLVIAFTGASVSPEPHAVCWAGVVTEKLTFAEYWHDARFQCKKPAETNVPDNIYKPQGNTLIQVSNPVHGEKHIGRDVGGHCVLLFDPAWRFGAGGPLLPEELGLRITGNRRNHRMTELTDSKWREIRQWLNSQKQAGPPITAKRRAIKRWRCG